MKASVELSMYPLDPAYGNVNLDFIKRLNQYPTLKGKRETAITISRYKVIMTYD